MYYFICCKLSSLWLHLHSEKTKLVLKIRRSNILYCRDARFCRKEDNHSMSVANSSPATHRNSWNYLCTAEVKTVKSKTVFASWFKCCLTSTETVGLLGTGAQDVHLDFYTAPELCFLQGFTQVFCFVLLPCLFICKCSLDCVQNIANPHYTPPHPPHHPSVTFAF